MPKGGENLYRLNDQLDRIKNATSLGKKEKMISAQQIPIPYPEASRTPRNKALMESLYLQSYLVGGQNLQYAHQEDGSLVDLPIDMELNPSITIKAKYNHQLSGKKGNSLTESQE